MKYATLIGGEAIHVVLRIVSTILLADISPLLNWEPKIKLEEGLKKTIEYFRNLPSLIK